MRKDHLADDSEYDVAIAGAGLAGASLALSLARRGLRVIVVEGATFPRDKLCGEFLSPECWGVLDRLGLSGEVESAGFHAIRTVRVTTPSGREVRAVVADRDSPPAIGLSRLVLDQRLVVAARQAGAVVLEGLRAGGPLLDTDGRVIGLRGGPEHRAIRARVTVAADGRHSALVKQTGETHVRSRFRPAMVGVKRHLSVPPEHAEPEGTVGLHLVPGGYVGTCRVEAGMSNLCAMIPQREVSARRGDLDRVSREVLGRNRDVGGMLDASRPVGAWKAVARVRVERSEPCRPGILYVGDGMGTVDPLGGQGMTMALLGAEAILPHVLAGLAGRADAATQRAWRNEWRKRFDRRVRLCGLFHQTLTRPGVVDGLARLGPAASGLLSRCYRWTRER